MNWKPNEPRDMNTKLDEAAKANIKLEKNVHVTMTSLMSLQGRIYNNRPKKQITKKSLWIISNTALAKTA